MILKCNCRHEPQDKLYGKDNRVYNYPCKSKITNRYTAARCTVCCSTKEVG